MCGGGGGGGGEVGRERGYRGIGVEERGKYCIIHYLLHKKQSTYPLLYMWTSVKWAEVVTVSVSHVYIVGTLLNILNGTQ